MTVRMRVVGWNVQPVVMADDGENLTPVTVNAQHIAASGWDQFKAGGDVEALDGLREQIEAQHAAADKLTDALAEALKTDS